MARRKMLTLEKLRSTGIGLCSNFSKRTHKYYPKGIPINKTLIRRAFTNHPSTHIFNSDIDYLIISLNLDNAPIFKQVTSFLKHKLIESVKTHLNTSLANCRLSGYSIDKLTNFDELMDFSEEITIDLIPVLLDIDAVDKDRDKALNEAGDMFAEWLLKEPKFLDLLTPEKD